MFNKWFLLGYNTYAKCKIIQLKIDTVVIKYYGFEKFNNHYDLKTKEISKDEILSVNEVYPKKSDIAWIINPSVKNTYLNGTLKQTNSNNDYYLNIAHQSSSPSGNINNNQIIRFKFKKKQKKIKKKIKKKNYYRHQKNVISQLKFL